MDWPKVRDQLKAEYNRLSAIAGAIDLVNEAERLRGDIPKMQEEFTKLKAGLDKLSADYQASEQRVNEHRSNSKKEIKEHQNLIDSLSEQVRDLRGELSSLRAAIDSAMPQLERVTDQLRTRTKELSVLGEQVDIKSRQVKELDAEINRLVANVPKILA